MKLTLKHFSQILFPLLGSATLLFLVACATQSEPEAEGRTWSAAGEVGPGDDSSAMLGR